MATTLYLQNALSDVSRGRNDTSKSGAAVAWRTNLLHPAVMTSTDAATTATVATVTGPTSGLEPGSPALEWITAPLEAITISGTITLNICADESSGQANATVSVIIEKLDKNLAVVSTISDSSFTTELSTQNADRQWTATPTSTNILRGERIRVRVYFDDGGGTMASGHTLTLTYGASQIGQNQPANSRITLTENLVFLNTPAPFGTVSKNTTVASASLNLTTRSGSVAFMDSQQPVGGSVFYRASLSGGTTSTAAAALINSVADEFIESNGTHVLVSGTASGTIPRLSTATSFAGPFTNRNPAGLTNGSFNAATYGADGYWVIAGGDPVTTLNSWIVYATDPTGTWTQKILVAGPVTAPDFQHVIYANGFWVVGGPQNSGQIWAINGTPDGTWIQPTSRGIAATSTVTGLAYNSGYFMVETNTGETAYATDPTGTWTLTPSRFVYTTFSAPIAAGGFFIKIENGVNIYAKKWPWDTYRFVYALDTIQTTMAVATDGINLVFAGNADSEIHYVALSTIEELYPTATVSDIANQGAGVDELKLWTSRGNG